MSKKNSAFYWVSGAMAAIALAVLPGCNSSSVEPSASAEQRTQQQAAGTKALAPQAQSLSAQQNQQKSQMDSMRAKDAAKTPQ